MNAAQRLHKHAPHAAQRLHKRCTTRERRVGPAGYRSRATTTLGVRLCNLCRSIRGGCTLHKRAGGPVRALLRRTMRATGDRFDNPPSWPTSWTARALVRARTPSGEATPSGERLETPSAATPRQPDVRRSDALIGSRRRTASPFPRVTMRPLTCTFAAVIRSVSVYFRQSAGYGMDGCGGARSSEHYDRATVSQVRTAVSRTSASVARSARRRTNSSMYHCTAWDVCGDLASMTRDQLGVRHRLQFGVLHAPILSLAGAS